MINRDDLDEGAKFAYDLGKLCHKRNGVSELVILANLEVMKFMIIDSMMAAAQEYAEEQEPIGLNVKKETMQ